MTIKNDYNKVVIELEKHKTKFKEKLSVFINDLMNEFENDTGFIITDIDINFLTHYYKAQKNKSIIADIKIRTNMDSDD